MKIVFKLLKFLLGLVGLCVLAYVAFFVTFGDKTLYQHMVGISKTEEAKALGDEVGKKVEHTAEQVTHTIKEKVPKLVETVSTPDKKAPDASTHDKSDKQALQKLIREKEQPSDQDREALQELIQQKNKP